MSGISYGNEVIGDIDIAEQNNIQDIHILDSNVVDKGENIGSMNFESVEYDLYKFPKNKKDNLNIKKILTFNGLFFKAPSIRKSISKSTEIAIYKEIIKSYEEKVQEVLDHGSVYILTNISNQILQKGGNIYNDSFNPTLTTDQKNNILDICIKEKTFDECNKTLSH